MKTATYSLPSINLKFSLLGGILVCFCNLAWQQKGFQAPSQASLFYPLTAEPDSNKLYLPNDLEATLWAETPMLYNPTNMDVDARGRIWITEAVEYREFNNKADKRLNFKGKGDRVMILEDTDDDGKADKSKIFIQDTLLTAPLGIAVIGKKIIVSCAPNLLVYTDENGDDIPDKREVLLTGFGGFDHDHSLHSAVAGPDGLWYFNTGNAGPHQVTDKSGWHLRSGSMYTGGTPYNKKNEGNQKSDDGRVWVGGMALRMNADGKGLKVMAHNFRNSYEVAVDSYGNLWQNDNDDQVIACRTSFVMENGNAGYFSADGTRSWQADRRPGQDMFTSSWHQEDPGVMPAGDNAGAGSPTGVCVYEGDALGKQYRGMLLSCEAGRNVVFSYLPKPQGAGFSLKRQDFISSLGRTADERYEWFETGKDTRKWFRPSDACVGTDGSLYVADWYDPIVGGHAMQDKIGYGRIYRITPKGKKLTPPKIDLSTTAGQLDALKNPAINVRNLGFEALKAQGASVLSNVKKLLTAENPYHQARAIWLMAQLGKEGVAEVEKLLKSPNNQVRLVAFRALKSGLSSSQLAFHSSLLATDNNPAIRREVAISLRDVPFEQKKGIIFDLLKGYDGKDPWYLEALGTAADGNEAQVYAYVQETMKAEPEMWPEKRVNLAWRLHPNGIVNDIKIRANSMKLSESARRKALTSLAFIKDKSAALAMIDLTKSKLTDVASGALWWVNFRKANDWAELLNWEETIATIMTESYKKMLDLKKLVGDKTQPIDKRIASAKLMAKDSDGGNMLLDMKAQYGLPDTITKSVSEDIFNNPNQNVRIVASQFFARKGQTVKMDFVARMKSNNEHGKTLFATYCTTCHRHGQKGAEIGPDLTKIHQKFDKISLIDAIVNPSASMVFGYEAYTITTTKNETFFGFIVSDGKTVVIKDAGGQSHAVKAENIKSREKMLNSLMPDPTSLGLKEQDLADLTGYLLSFK